jgi:titin
VAFSASSGEVTDYTASCTSSDGGTPGSATGTNSPINVSGLTNGKSYSCTVTANGPGGSSSASTPSTPATPTPPPPNPIPILATWASALMTLMLLLGGLWFGRRGRIG